MAPWFGAGPGHLSKKWTLCNDGWIRKKKKKVSFGTNEVRWINPLKATLSTAPLFDYLSGREFRAWKTGKARVWRRRH